MARSRNIKPGFFQNETLAELPPLARLAFIGMWTVADFKGCFEYRPKRLKVQILPYDDCDIREIVANLAVHGFINVYQVDGAQYIKIINFTKHQNPHKNEENAGSAIPDITEDDLTSKNNTLSQDGTKPDKIGTKPDKIGTARADSLNLIPDSLLLIPDCAASAGVPLSGANLEKVNSLQKKDCAKNAHTAKRKTRIPDDWEIERDDANYRYAIENGMTEDDLEREADKFFAHHKGKGTLMVDWGAAWQYWTRNWQSFSQQRR